MNSKPSFQRLFSIYLLLFLPILLAQQVTRGCREDLPNLSVTGTQDSILTLNQWDSIYKKRDILIIGVSDSDCPTCCQSEGILDDFTKLNLKHKGKIIPVLRIDISKPESKSILTKEEISFEAVPRVIIYRDQRFFSYDAAYDNVHLLLHQINRLLNPLVTLSNESDIERFLGLDPLTGEPKTIEDVEHWEADYNTTFMRQLGDKVPRFTDEGYRGLPLKTRVVQFVFDKQEYKEELANLRRDARMLSTRDNLRIGLVENHRLVKKMKAGKWGPRMFATVSMSSLVLRRYDGTIKYHDMTGDDHVSIAHWINKNTLKEVQELTNESYRIQELLRQPMFIAFIDFQDPKQGGECMRAVEVLKEVAPKYSHILGFFYVNNTNFLHRKRVLGVTWDELPSMAFNMLGDSTRVMPYPRNREISKKALFDFFDDLFTGRSGQGDQMKQEYRPPTDFSKTVKDTDIEKYLLNNTIIATRYNYNELVYQEGYDALVLLYSTEVISDGQRTVALQFNLVADAFRQLKEAFPLANIGTSVRVISYDVNVNAFPDGIEYTVDLPQILFVPAYSKRPPFRRYIGQAAIAGPILEFVQKNAEIKFKYPVDVSKVGFKKERQQQQEVIEEGTQQEEVQQEPNEDL